MRRGVIFTPPPTGIALSCCLLKNEAINYSVLQFYFFAGRFSNKKKFLKNLAISHNFGLVFKMCSKLEKTVLIIKILFWMFFDLFQRVSCNEYKS